MMDHFRKLSFILPIFFVVACGGGGSSSSPNPEVSATPEILVSRSAPVVHSTQQMQLSAALRNAQAADYTFQWERTDSAEVNLLDSLGQNESSFVFTAPDVADITTMNFKVTATITGGETLSQEISLDIYPNPRLVELPILEDINLRNCLQRNTDVYNWGYVTDITELTCLGEKIDGIERYTALKKISYFHNEKFTEFRALSTLPLLEELNFTNSGISSLSWIEELENPFPSLTVLNLFRNDLTDIQGVEFLQGLEFLNLQENEISDLSPLANHPSLQTLYIGGKGVDYNQTESIITIGNPEVLTEIANLSSLVISDANIGTLDFIERMQGLKSLGIHNTDIEDASKIGSLSQLTHLGISSEIITSTAFLANLTVLEALFFGGAHSVTENIRHLGLKSLSLWGTEELDLSPIAEMTTLNVVQVRSADITDINALAKLTNLETLDLPSNNISDISAAANLTNLVQLDLGGNEITDVSPLANLTKLETLDLSGNQIFDVSPLANLTRLETLDLSSNEIVAIPPLPNLTSLETLYLSSNPYLVDIQALTELTGLYRLRVSFPEFGGGAITCDQVRAIGEAIPGIDFSLLGICSL